LTLCTLQITGFYSSKVRCSFSGYELTGDVKPSTGFVHTEQPLSLANRVTACQKATEVFAIENMYTSSTDLKFIAHCLGDITAFETWCPFTDDNYGEL